MRRRMEKMMIRNTAEYEQEEIEMIWNVIDKNGFGPCRIAGM